MNHLALQTVRSLQRAGGLGYIALKNTLPDERRRPRDVSGITVLDQCSHLERQRGDDEAVHCSELRQQPDVS